jgi:GTP-binding protein
MNNNQEKQSSSQAPPWQVVSKKDMAKNLQAEKERRKLAQQGIHNAAVEDREYSISKSFLSPQDKALLAWKRFKSSPTDEIDFIGAYLDKQLPPRLGAPEVAFLGRSNVGKSSLLNNLVGSDSARVGKTPGATASVNLYGIFRKDKAIMGLVDLPGFGYAKLSKESKESVQMAAENYLDKRKELVLGILLVDIRRVPSDDDRAVLAALFDMGVSIIVVATKVDKLSVSQTEESLEAIRDGLGLPVGQPLCVSSVTGQGIKDLWRIIMEACETGVQELRSKLEQGGGDKATEVFPDEDDEIAYSQGFDWIHDSESVMYEADEFMYEDSHDEFEEDDEEKQQPLDRESIKYLRQKAKEMEKRGEFSP